MKTSFIFALALATVLFAFVGKADVAWEEDFDPIKATWTEVGAYWSDLAGPTAKLTENNPSQTYGVATSETITVDVSKYSELVIVSTAIDTNALYSIQIQNANDANDYNDAVSYNGDPGIQIVDIAELMNWSGTKSFVINVYIDGEGKSATFDLLQLREPSPGRTGWLEDFEPIKVTWDEATCDWNDVAGPNAILTENDPCHAYGVARSEVITLDVNEFSQLYLNVTDIEQGCLYSVQIHEEGENPDYNDAISYQGDPGEHYINIATLMNWHETRTFRVNIWLDTGLGGYSTTFDTIEIYNRDLSERPEPIFWEDHFDPLKSTWFEMGAYWTDTPDSNAILTEDNPGLSYGKVESETLTVDMDIYPELTVVVTDVETDGSTTIGIQEQGGAWAYKDVISNVIEPNCPNTFKANIADEMGWNGYRNFRVVIWIDGNGKSATFDLVRVAMDCGTDVLPGDYYEDCIVDLKDMAFIGQSWMDEYGLSDLDDISDNWLVEEY